MSRAVEGVALLPCPFCGGKGDIESQPSYDQAAATYQRHRGWCDQCGFGLDWHSYEPDAITAWNTRTTPPARSYADGVEDAAKVVECSLSGSVLEQEIFLVARIAAAIRLLSQEPSQW